jgi:hypothetical protein
MILEELLYFGFLAYVIAYSFGLVLILDGMEIVVIVQYTEILILQFGSINLKSIYGII